MPDCDHSAMRVDGRAFATACPGCDEIIGKFVCADHDDGELVFTTKRAFDSHRADEHDDEA